MRSLNYWQIGQDQPLPFFARTSLKTAQKWHEKAPDEDSLPDDAKRTAYTEYHGNKVLHAQASENEVALVFNAAHPDDEPIHQALFADIIKELCLPMYALSSSVEAGEENEA